MAKQNNTTTGVLFFVLGMCLVAALAIGVLRESTLSIAERNEEIFNKRAVLSSIADKLITPEAEAEGLDGQDYVADLGDEVVLDIFDRQMEQVVINMEGEVMDGMLAEDIDTAKEKKKEEEDRVHPLYIYNGDGEKYYIMSLRGNGLWDEIWGYVALSNDLNTIVGAAFDHKGETPGLGAEIKDNPWFPEQFTGKKIYNAEGQFVSVAVVKGGADKGDYNAVDGLSGATVTADGVSKMIKNGIQYYLPYFRKIGKESKPLMGQNN